MAVSLPDKLNHAALDELELLAHGSYQSDFGDDGNLPEFKNKTVDVKRNPHPVRKDRQYTYWHCVTEGHPENRRRGPVRERLERMPWIRAVIEAAGEDDIKVWKNQRKGKPRYCIWFHKVRYIVILKILSAKHLLLTAYCPDMQRQQQLHREYAGYRKRKRN